MIVDTNVYLARWPFRRLAGDETPDLLARMRRHGVGQVWAGSFDALLHRDVEGVNARLADECKRHGAGMLLPFGTVNPKLPDWREDLRRCAEAHRMPGIRLHPNYHGYGLSDAEFGEVLRLATEARLVVQLVIGLEDERTQHPLLRVPVVDMGPLEEAVKSVPGLRLVVLNQKRDPRNRKLAATGRVWFDIANVEGAGGVGAMAEEIGAEHVVFGSHFPLFVFESSVLKMREAGFATKDEKAIFEDNARGLLRA